jgi:hypothetical protein
MASRRKKEREVLASSSGSEGEEEEEEETGSKAKLQIPVARVRKLIKSDPGKRMCISCCFAGRVLITPVRSWLIVLVLGRCEEN